MNTYKFQLSTIQFPSLDNLMDALVMLDRVRLTQIDHLAASDINNPDNRDRDGIEDSAFSGIALQYEYNSQNCTLNVTSDSGVIGQMITQTGDAYGHPAFKNSEYMDFICFFQNTARSVHPIFLTLYTYQNNKLVGVEVFNVADHQSFIR
jgi:hypothetical protein